jgi:hypothetical protein
MIYEETVTGSGDLANLQSTPLIDIIGSSILDI